MVCPVDFTSRPQVGALTRRLVRLIHAENLQPGDRLPAQEELRTRLGFHSNTLNAAMRVLTAHGVVTRKRKVGTVVIDPGVTIPNLWRVAVAVFPAVGEQAYYGQLLHMVQTRLHAAGAVPSLFMMPERPAGGNVRFRHFPQLAEAVAADALDGVLTFPGIDGENWPALRRRGLALVHVGAWEDAPAGVEIDEGRLVQEAVAWLCDHGCRRLAVVSMKGPGVGFDRFWKSFRNATGRAGLRGSAARSLFGGEGPHGGQRVAEQLLAMRPATRPDGLVVIDDRVATGLTATLAAAGDGYRPTLVVQTNRQAPLAFALPVIHCEVDIADLARRAVDKLITQLRDPRQPLEREWVYAAWHSDTPQHLVTGPAAAKYFAGTSA